MAEKIRATSQDEDNFRDSLSDVVTTAKGLAPYCQNLAELVSMVELALKNDGQLRVIMSLVKGK